MKHALIGLLAETSIHAGAGKSAGVIDLPIMREAHTGWPCVFGSAVKGAMRCRAEQLQEKAWLTDVFGPDNRNASDHAGALSVGDARLLLLPVRSLTTHFKWVTCPALLARAARDAARHGLKAPELDLPSSIDDEVALVASDAASLFLEEFHFRAEKTGLDNIIAWLAGYVADADIARRLQAQLVIVNDDIFAHLAQYTTPVTPHIAIDNTRKTAIGGALWYEETLPPETVLYVSLLASAARRDKAEVSADAVLQHALGLFPEGAPYLQLGGNETVGMGWCRVQKVGG
jgi:CRISPR-associated protein Cmr4